MLSGRIRRRLITAPAPSRPTTLQLFLPRSIPRTAICIDETPFSPLALSAYAVRVEGAGHPINFPERLAEITARDAPGKPIEVWFQDEARVGQKNKITRRWAKRGSRPSAPSDQRTESTYIFGAICPERGVGAGLVLPWCNNTTMGLHLDEISQAVSPGAHAVVLLDQAGWHTSAKLKVPANISLLPLPPKSPELNPTENVWQYMRDNWLSNRVFASGHHIVDHCCDAWNKLVDQPWTIMSIGLRQWAYG